MRSISDCGMAEPPQITVCTLGKRRPLCSMTPARLIQMVGTPARMVAASCSARSRMVCPSPMKRSGRMILAPVMPQA